MDGIHLNGSPIKNRYLEIAHVIHQLVECVAIGTVQYEAEATLLMMIAYEHNSSAEIRIFQKWFSNK